LAARTGGSVTRRPAPPDSVTGRPASADDQGVVRRRDELADDGGAGDLAGDEEAAGGLGVGEQQPLLLVRAAEVGVRGDPGEVAAGAAAGVPGADGLAGAPPGGGGRGGDPGA